MLSSDGNSFFNYTQGGRTKVGLLFILQFKAFENVLTCGQFVFGSSQMTDKGFIIDSIELSITQQTERHESTAQRLTNEQPSKAR